MQDRKPDSILGLLLRIYWTMVGNAVLAIAAMLPLAHPDLSVGAWLAAVAASGLALALARYLDISACGGQTVGGEPADLGHWRRYVAILAPVAALLAGIGWAFAELR